MRLALEGKNSNNVHHNTDFKNSRTEKIVEKEDEELSDLEEAKLKNKN